MTALELRKTVLIVEDDRDTRDLLFLCLSAAGYCVQAAEDRETALTIALDTNPIVVIMDLYMPGMSVEEFMAKVNRYDCPTEVILVSAGPEVRRRAGELGLRHVLRKPFELDELVQIVHGCASKKA